MSEAIYKIGDILELDGNASFPRQFGMFPKDTKIRCMVLKHIKPGYEFVIYTLLVYKIDGSFDTVGINQKDLVTAAKRVGHIDISSFLSNEESTEPDYALFFAAATLAQAADLRNENEKLKANLAEETLKRKQAEAEPNEKAEELDRVYHSDIVCENNKLRDENRILNEIVNGFKSTCNNCEARSENEALKRESEELRGYIKELEQALSKSKKENEELTQKISCADKLLAEAANRLYQGRAQLNISAHN